MSIPEFRAHTAAVVEALTDATLNAAEGQVPAGVGWQGTPGQSEFVPYHIVWPLPGSRLDGTLAAAHDDGSLGVQVSSWAPTAEGAERGGDAARAVLLAGLDVTGRSIMHVRYDSCLGVVRDDTLGDPALWHAVDRYRIETTPA